MIKTTLSVLALTVALGMSVAHAATLVNRDPSTHKIVIVEGDARKEMTIESAQDLTDICKSSCAIYVDDDPEPYDLASSDKVEIQDGQLQYQEEPTPGGKTQ